VTIGAATRQAEAEVSEIVTDGVPLLAAALPRVGHQPTRNRGTIGGSIANGDPAAEIPLVATTLQADIVVAHEDGARTINARDFFLGIMSTALPVGGCVREVRFPVWAGARIGVGFHEISARRSDFAYVAAAAQVSLDEDERCVAIALGLGGPIAIDLHELVGSHLSQAAIADTARGCVDKAIADLDVASDLHASARYRISARLQRFPARSTMRYARLAFLSPSCRSAPLSSATRLRRHVKTAGTTKHDHRLPRASCAAAASRGNPGRRAKISLG
jgi:CO/xanthine dehydrogenase FAD-binding subunit